MHTQLSCIPALYNLLTLYKFLSITADRAVLKIDRNTGRTKTQTCLPLKMKNSTLTAKNSKINKKRVNLETFGFAVNEHMHYSNSPTHFFNQLFSVNVQAHQKKTKQQNKEEEEKKEKKKTPPKCSTSSLLPVPSLVKLSVAKPGRHLMKHKLDALS